MKHWILDRSIKTNERFLSFAWVVYDVLAQVRQDEAGKHQDAVPEENPLYPVTL